MAFRTKPSKHNPMSYFKRYTESLHQALAKVECTTREKRALDPGEMIDWLCRASRRIQEGGRRQFFMLQ